VTPRPPKLWIVTLGGAGLLPKMPGTYGSAVTALLVWLAWHFLGYTPWILIGGLVLFSALCVAYGGWAQEFLGRKDPGPVVLDEAAGICLTLLCQPMKHAVLTLIAAFLAFRLFDIVKPPPCRQLESLPAGWGILMDDLAAAVYANLLCQLILRLF
jgi:phosphatidylglycerophosphatase A